MPLQALQSSLLLTCETTVRCSVQATVVLGLVLLLRTVGRRWMTCQARYALWFLVLLRLFLPTTPQSRISLFTLASPVWRWVQQTTRPTDLTRVDAQPAHLLTGRPIWTVRYASQAAKTPSIAAPPLHTAERNVQAASQGAWLAIVWIFGSAAALAGFVAAQWSFMRQVRRTAAPAPDPLTQTLCRCCQELHIRRSPALLITPAVAGPAVTGVWRPTLLLPPRTADELSPEQLRVVFLHELMHLRAHDVAVEWMWNVLFALHWFNPLLWLSRPLRRLDREQARDEAVLSVSTHPTDAAAYGRVLLRIAQTSLPAPLQVGVIAMASGKRELEQRIEMISSFERPTIATRCLRLLLVAATGAAALTTPLRPNAFAAAPTDPAGASSTPQPPTTRPDAKTALDLKLQHLTFDRKPLSDVIDAFRTITGANIYVDWPALERAGVASTAPVTVRLRQISAGKALQLVFKSVESDGYDRQLGYVFDDNGHVVTISTQKELDKNVETRRYDVNDLLFIPVDYDAPTANTAATRPAHAAVSSTALAREQRIADIERYIMDNVAPNTWVERGGHSGQRPSGTSESKPYSRLYAPASVYRSASRRGAFCSTRRRCGRCRQRCGTACRRWPRPAERATSSPPKRCSSWCRRSTVPLPPAKSPPRA